MKPFHESDPFGKKWFYNILLLLYLTTCINPGANDIGFILTPGFSQVDKRT